MIVLISNSRRVAYSGLPRRAPRRPDRAARDAARAPCARSRKYWSRLSPFGVGNGGRFLAELERQIAALGDLDAVGERLRNIGEQFRHLRLRLEILIGREMPRPALIGEHIALGDAHARLVRAKVVARRETAPGESRRPAVSVRLASCSVAAVSACVVGAGRRAAVRDRSGREKACRHAAPPRRGRLYCPAAAPGPTSPCGAPDSAIRPSVPAANHSRLNSARPRYWLVR